MQSKPQRRSFRFAFSLRTLLVVVTIACLWVGYSVNWIRQRHHFLAAVRGGEYGGRVSCNEHLTTTAPGGLWLLGEGGIREFLTIGVTQSIDEQIQRLFPEAEIWKLPV